VFTATAQPVDFSALKPQGHVSDFAGVVDRNLRADLERYCASVEASTGAEMALVTLPTLAGEPVEDVANLLYRKWGIGKKETDEGILLLLVIQDRRSRLEVGYGLEPYIPDGYAGSLLRQMRPALSAGRYGEAMAVAAQTIGARIAEAKGVAIEQAPASGHRTPSKQPAPWGSLLGGLVMLFWLFGMGRGRRGRSGRGGGLLAGMLLGNLLGRGMYGGRSGGGFGGFDSFDSFGGFGGGDSGGGGASGGW
jgi:uncharacterized protein